MRQAGTVGLVLQGREHVWTKSEAAAAHVWGQDFDTTAANLGYSGKRSGRRGLKIV